MSISSAMRPLRLAWAAAAFSALAWAPSAGAVEPEKFLIGKTSDMVALCAANASDDNYVAAIHFCHGFASGAFQYYQALAANSPDNRFICLPNPAPTRSAAIADFVVWAHKTPDALNAKPVDSMFRYLHGRYPCPKTTTALEPKAKP
jgi:hypothetical protein